MKIQAKLYEGEAVQFTGKSMLLEDDNGDKVRIFGSMHGHFVRRKDNTMTQIEVGDWIITKPEFRVIDKAAFRVQFDIIPETGSEDDGSAEHGD